MNCQHLADCIVNHCRTLKNRPDADPLLRRLAARLETEWQALALPAGRYRYQENRHV